MLFLLRRCVPAWRRKWRVRAGRFVRPYRGGTYQAGGKMTLITRICIGSHKRHLNGERRLWKHY